jgi:hypothetical protein
MTASDGTLRRTASLLDELLVHSIKLRDLYKTTRSDQLIARSGRRRVIEARQEGLDAHGSASG